jgi:hypothetical protein
MDAYPSDYTQHNLPLIVLSGLGHSPETDAPPHVHNVLPGRAVTTISTETLPVIGDRADLLLQDLLSADGSNAPWNGRAPTLKGITQAYRIRAVGRVG